MTLTAGLNLFALLVAAISIAAAGSAHYDHWRKKRDVTERLRQKETDRPLISVPTDEADRS